ncbi:MAG TPA: hypothetical protein VG815_17335 [Chloroflexota bacterium]|jgi:Tol biopolymer transport system component|nr:hypothetical protein [Chloroflexota bacterium]
MMFFARTLAILIGLAALPASQAAAGQGSGPSHGSSACSTPGQCRHGPLSAVGPKAAAVSVSPWVAYTLDGAVYVVRADGRGRHQVSTREDASEPALAPGGRFVAFLSGPLNTLRVKSIRVARVGGPPKAGVAVRQCRQTLGSLVWSPNGRQFAFVSRFSIWVAGTTGRAPRMIIPGTRNSPRWSPIWSPDSRYVAASFRFDLLPHGIPGPRLGVAVADTATGSRTSEFIDFPAWLPRRNHHFIDASVPGSVIGWLTDGSLLASTFLSGAGVPLDGVWSAPPGGGPARLIVGAVKNRRLEMSGPLNGATSALLSPDGSRLLLNPGSGAWVGPATGGLGRFVSLHVGPRFVVSQIAWEGNHELAFDRLRIKSHNMAEWFLMKLSSFSLASGHTTPLAHLWGPDQEQLEVAAPTRCQGCGVG